MIGKAISSLSIGTGICRIFDLSETGITPEISTGDLLERLAGKFLMVAHKYTSEPEDVSQEICLKLLELDRKDPNFLVQKTPYIVSRARWIAQHVTEKAAVYNRRVVSIEGGSDDDPDNDPLENLPAHIVTPEDALEFSEISSLVEDLPEKDRRIVFMLVSGYQQVEIAKKLGVSPAAISQRISSVRKQLEVAYA